MFAHLYIIHSCAKKDPHRNNVLVLFREVYQPYSKFVEEGILLQRSIMFCNVIFVALWHSSKAVVSVCHDKVLVIVVIT